MFKRFSAAAVVAATLLANMRVTLGAADTAQYAESKAELLRAEAMLNGVVMQVKQQELKAMAAMDPKKVAGGMNMDEFLTMVAAKKDTLQKMSSYRDMRMVGSFDDMVKMIKDKGDPIDESTVALYKEIDTYKQTNNAADPVAVVQYFNAKAGLQEQAFLGLSFGTRAMAYSISYDAWTKLTTGEKLLIASSPTNAILTDSLAKKAFQWEREKFGYNGLGDKGDGYRHGSWNALMTRDISRAWAEAYATAHEDKTQAELQQKETDGFYKWQHRDMDLHNNKKGRDQIAWYEFSFNCSDATVKSRISAKLTNNKSTGIYWLHN